MNNNIYAYTELTYKNYPGYVSLNEREGKYFLTVRSREGANVSEIEISDSELVQLAKNILIKVM